MRWARIYRVALRLLPADLRRKHDRAMETLFASELERGRSRGRLRVTLVGAMGVWDIIRRAFYEWGRRGVGAIHGNGARHRDHERERRWTMGSFIDELRFGIRSLGRAGAFTATSVAILALGIGAATTVFTGFRAIVLEELPVTDPDRLVSLSLERAAPGEASFTAEEVDALRRESRTLVDVAGVASTGAVAIPLTEGERSLVLDMSRVTANFFQVLGARPVLGRLLRPEDGEPGAAPVTVISYDTWQREFGGDPGVLGRYLTQTQYQDAYAIVGVATPGLDYPVGVDYWIPVGAREGMSVVARLAPDVAPEAARSEFLSIARVIDGRRSRPRSPTVATVRPLPETVLGDARPVLVAIAAAVTVLLLIACVNVGNLLLMRAAQRSRDVVLHRALGATSGRIARLFLVEATVLGVAAGAVGLVIAVWLLRVLPALAPDRLPRVDMIAHAGAPLAVTLAVTGLAVLLFGVGPAVAAARGDLGAALRAAGHGGSGTKGRHRLRRFLVAAQVALAVILLASGGLLVRSFQRLAQLELGYDAEAVAIVELGINREAREGPEETFAMLEGVLERMRTVPGVTAATPIMIRPFMGETGIFQTRPMLEGQSESDAEFNPQLPLEVGGHELFRALGLPIIRGRGLRETDREGAPLVAVVSQAVAERLWPGEDPIGKRIHLVTSEAAWWTVVGVTGDTRFRRLRESTPTVFLHWRQLQILPGVWTVAVRTEQDFASVGPTMRRVVREFDPRVHVWRVGTLNDHLSRGPLARPRMSALLLSGFGLAALLLAATGLYGVMALAVRERTHELGVRKALGASSGRLQWAVLGDALIVTLAGTVAGLVGALLMSRLLVTLLFEVSPADPAALLGVIAMLLTVAMVAAYLPARRATRIDPMRALRSD